MKRRIIITCLLLCLLALACLCVSASADSSVTLADSVFYDEGYTIVTWSVDGAAPSKMYLVYEQIADDGGTHPMLSYGEVSGTRCSTVDLLPGKRYRVTLLDEAFSELSSKEYRIPEPALFEDGKLKHSSIKVTITPRRMKAGGNTSKDAKKVKSFNAQEMIDGINGGVYAYGLKFQMKMPQLKKQRTFFVTVYIEDPDGFAMAAAAQDIEFARVNHGYQTIWFELLGQRYFEAELKKKETIPAGQYKVHLFWDGMMVGVYTFNVR